MKYLRPMIYAIHNLLSPTGRSFNALAKFVGESLFEIRITGWSSMLRPIWALRQSPLPPSLLRRCKPLLPAIAPRRWGGGHLLLKSQAMGSVCFTGHCARKAMSARACYEDRRPENYEANHIWTRRDA